MNDFFDSFKTSRDIHNIISIYERTTVSLNFNSCPFPYIYNKRCAIKEIIGNVIMVLIKKIINNLPMLTGILEPSMTPPTSDK